jgi:hypothetical protein
MQQAYTGRPTQCAGAVFMVDPASFAFNEQTAASNAMQRADTGEAGTDVLLARVRTEAQLLRRALESEGVRVLLVADTAVPRKPDAVFPNNWISFHADGTLVLYPLLAPNRRFERRMELVDEVCAALNFQPRRRLDLTAHEASGKFLEGTGSLVLDHVARVAYACRSPRTDESLVHEWVRQMDYQALVFDATDAQGQAYYHTNVLMWIGSRCLMVCAAAIAAADRARVMARLRHSGRELIEIDRDAVEAFAGNMLELATWDEALGDATVLVMSARAKGALSAAQLRQLSGSVDTVLAVPVPTIERVGGGSVRCMLAEVPETRP